MNKLWQTLLSLNSLRKSIGFSKTFSATKFNFHVEKVDSLSYKKALVLAPHPDDEVFGCGGTLKKLSSSGCDITVVYFCDGSAGVDENAEEKKDQNLIGVRRKEAQESSKLLGVKEQIFLGFADGKLAANSESIKAMNELIEKVKPEIIFLPSFLDNHPDHRAVNDILMQSKIENQPEIWSFQVWTPIWVNRLVSINGEIETKERAMKMHLSQLKSRNYDEAILGLNKYQAEINNIEGYAEGFFATSLEIYRILYRKNK